MAERSSSLACKKFSANVFDKNKCQNCFKPKDAHNTSPTMPERPTTLEVGTNRPKTTVKSGNLFIATQVSTLPKIQVQKWEKMIFMLYSSGVLEWFHETAKPGQVSLGSISLDDCSGLTSAECDTNEPFSIGVKTSAKTYYIKAENRLEMDNWCRVLKPFVIASPGYNFNKKSPTTRALGYHDSKIGSFTNTASQERKTSLSRTVSAPWQASIEQKNTTGSGSVDRKRWSATEELLAKKEPLESNTKSNARTSKETKKTNSTEKQTKTDPSLQPYYTDLYVKPEPSSQKQNGETSDRTTALEKELAETKRAAKLNQGKAEMCSKNLTETKKQLEKANNIISIQKANVEALTTEVENLKIRLRKSEEVVEKRLNELELPTCNGNSSRDSIESGFIKLQAKLQENEKALIRRTRELEKANESRKKVAKHTRALLVELEGKLTENNRRITELEEQLMNKTLDLQYEKEERQRIERERGQLVKDLTTSKHNSKQREVTKRSTELLQQAKEEHELSKTEQKIHQEIEALNQKLEGKNAEITKLQQQLTALDKKEKEFRAIETAYKNASDLVEVLRSELGLGSEGYNKEKTYNELEMRVQDVSAMVKEKDKQAKEIQRQNAELKSEIERTRKECDTQVLLLQEDNETTRIRLHEVQEELEALHTETDGRNPEFEELSRDFEKLQSKSEKNENEFRKLKDSQIETVRNLNNEKNKRLKLEKDFEESCSELASSQKEVEKLRELLRNTEGKFQNALKRVSEVEELYKNAKENGKTSEAKLAEVVAKIENYESEIKELRENVSGSHAEITGLNKELKRRTKTETQILNRIESLESSLSESCTELVSSNSKVEQSKTDDCIQEKATLLDAIESLGKKAGILNSSLKEEREKNRTLEQSLQAVQSSSRRCSGCEKRESESSGLLQDLEDAKANHRKEMDRLRQSMDTESQTLKSQADEMKLKLTSKVILLQSDISELNSKHGQDLNQVNEQHRKEVESWREKHESELNDANEKHRQDVETLKKNHERELLQLRDEHKKNAESSREKYELGVNQLSAKHQQDLDTWREKCESLNEGNNKEIASLREKLEKVENELLTERESNERRIKALKNEYESNLPEGDASKNGVLLEEVKEKHSKELAEIKNLIEAYHRKSGKSKYDRKLTELDVETTRIRSRVNGVQVTKKLATLLKQSAFGRLIDMFTLAIDGFKENHRRELEENKSDMMMVLQALKSDSYQSSSMSNESLEMNDELKNLERYVETLKKEHEQEIERLNQEHEQDLEQLRRDMVTLLRVQETYKTPDDGKADPNGNIVDLDGQLASLKRSHERELREKDEKHQVEVDQLKSDMLVAIQAASAVGNVSTRTSAAPDKRVTELEACISKMERDFEEERENLQNAIKKAESATKFGLRRNEEMSNKIYQMQREMEEIDTKYQKEIKLYKEAFDQEKNRKTTIGAVPGILAENESLKVKLQESELSMEQMQVRYDGEIKRYKEKFQQENVLSVEELQLKIKSLEDSTEQMRLEHENELERYTKAVKRGKVSLGSSIKERDLERKIDDLESTVNVMRQKHREEVRKYRERLEDEMERHRKEIQESRAKLRKLEADTRQMEDMKNKISELENKTAKLSKDASKCKEQEIELNETKSKNRELQRQVDTLKRKLDKHEEATEETKETSNESQLTSARTKLPRYSSLDNIGLNASNKTKPQSGGSADGAARNEDDVFEVNNNNSGKQAEIGGYKLNPGLKRPASVSAFPVQNENGSRRTTYSEKKRDNGSTSNRSSYQPSGYLKSSTSASSLK